MSPRLKILNYPGFICLSLLIILIILNSFDFHPALISAALELGNVHYILKNGEPEEKIDILFIPYHNMPDIPSMVSFIEDAVLNKFSRQEVGLFNVEPFKSNKDRFNIAYVDKKLDKDFFYCGKRYFGDVPCDSYQIEKLYEVFQPDFITVLVNAYYTSQGGRVMYLSVLPTWSSDEKYLGKRFIHEFGHQFGQLADEYAVPHSSFSCGNSLSPECFASYTQELTITPNVDTIGCPKWCQSYDFNKDQELIEGLQFCGRAKSESECEASNQDPSRPFYYCVWYNLEHPFFRQHCIVGYGAGDIGISCQEGTGCFFGGNLGQLAFRPSENSIMNVRSLEFNRPSLNHLKSVLDCCYPRRENPFCNDFRNKFSKFSKFSQESKYTQIAFCGADISDNPLFCRDSDLGFNLYTYGELIYREEKHSDICVDAKKLQEYYCYEDGYGADYTTCDYGCENGACLKEPEIKTFSIPLYRGWNLVSSPTKEPLTIEKLKRSCSIVRPYFLVYSASAKEWALAQQISAGWAGYILIDWPCTLEVEGEKARVTEWELERGWNLISFDKPLNQIKGDCEDFSNWSEIELWDYDARFRTWQALSLDASPNPFKGYWVKTKRSCDLY